MRGPETMMGNGRAACSDSLLSSMRTNVVLGQLALLALQPPRRSWTRSLTKQSIASWHLQEQA